MLNIAICDDEEFYIEKIEKGVKTFLQQTSVQEYRIETWNSGEELCSDQQRLEKYQIIFLDVNMQQMDGFEAARKIRRVNEDVFLVFVTAYVDYAVEGYKVDAVRFLIKDSLTQTLPECMETILGKMDYKKKKEVFEFLEMKREVAVHKISHVESQKHKLLFYINNNGIEQYTMYGKLDELETTLGPYGFIRIHRSFLVNVKEIVEIKNYRVIMKNNENLPVPRDKYRQVKEKYFEMRGEI